MGENPANGTPDPSRFAYRFRGFPPKEAGVVIDQVSGTIRFEHCFQKNHLLSRVEPAYECPIDDLLDAHRLRYRGETLTILTREGKATLLRSDGPFLDLCHLLDRLIPPGRQGPELSNPWMTMAAVGAAFAGALSGWLITPTNGGDAQLYTNMAGMAVLGPGLVGFIVLFSQRLLGIRLATPLGTSIIGLYLASPIWMLSMASSGLNVLGSAGIFGGGFLLGAGFGVWLQLRKDARREAAWATSRAIANDRGGIG